MPSGECGYNVSSQSQCEWRPPNVCLSLSVFPSKENVPRQLKIRESSSTSITDLSFPHRVRTKRRPSEATEMTRCLAIISFLRISIILPSSHSLRFYLPFYSPSFLSTFIFIESEAYRGYLDRLVILEASSSQLSKVTSSPISIS